MAFKHFFSNKADKNDEENITTEVQEFEEDIYNTESNEDTDAFDDDLYDDTDTTPLVSEEDVLLTDSDDKDIYDLNEYVKDDESTARINNIEISDKNFKRALDQIARRGETLVVAGLQGSGTSTLAANIATALNRIGYKVLIVDLDTESKSQHYISKDSFDSMNLDSNNLQEAVNQDLSRVYSYITLVVNDLHLLGTGIACEPYELSHLNNFIKITKLIEILKKEYDFIVCDVPLKTLIYLLPDLANTASDIVLNIDSGAAGIINTINTICNSDNELLLETMFSEKTNVIFNKHRGIKTVLDKQINLESQKALEVMDKIVTDFADCEIDYNFADMKLIGNIPLNPEIDNYVTSKTQFCDTPNGKEIILQLIKNIMIK